MFFTVIIPMEYDNGMGDTPCDLTKPRIAPCKNTWKPLQNTVYWCNLNLAQERGLLFYQTRSHAIVLYDTLPAVCIEKAVCMKTKEELHQKVRLTLRLSLVVLKANSHSGQQDQRDQDARSSWDPPNESKSYRETWNNAVDYRILGTPIFDSRTAGYKSPIQGQEVDRKVRDQPAQGILPSGLEPDAEDQQVQQRIEGFDRRHEQHRDLRALRKLFQKAMLRLQYLLEIGIVYCSCGRNFFLKKTRRDETSSKRTTTTSPQSLAMLLRRIAVAVPNVDLLNDKECTTRIKTCCTKLVKRNMEDTHPFLRGDTATTSTEIR